MDAALLAAKRQAYRQALAEALDRIVAALARLPEVHRVVLFGSYAQGRADLLTDLDLLVVMDSELDFVTRTACLYRYLQAGVDLDLLVYTPEEFVRAVQGSFLRKALEKGKVLYEKRPA